MHAATTVSFTLALFLVGATVIAGTETAGDQYHWSLSRDAEPKNSHYLGHPVSHYEVSLERLTVFSCAKDEEQFEADQCREIERSGLGFEVIQDLNNDGESDRAVVGVATTRGGEKLGVLLICNSMSERNPFVLTSSFNRFSVLESSERGLIWGPCLACDSIYPIRWDDDSGRYEIVVPEAFGDVGQPQ